MNRELNYVEAGGEVNLANLLYTVLVPSVADPDSFFYGSRLGS